MSKRNPECGQSEMHNSSSISMTWYGRGVESPSLVKDWVAEVELISICTGYDVIVFIAVWEILNSIPNCDGRDGVATIGGMEGVVADGTGGSDVTFTWGG